MQFPQHFLRATTDYSTLTHFVPAPCFRKSFTLEAPAVARVVIGACGFYELFLNGQRRTKGALAPYISNPDDIVYYDAYTLPLQAGENVTRCAGQRLPEQSPAATSGILTNLPSGARLSSPCPSAGSAPTAR